MPYLGFGKPTHIHRKIDASLRSTSWGLWSGTFGPFHFENEVDNITVNLGF